MRYTPKAKKLFTYFTGFASPKVYLEYVKYKSARKNNDLKYNISDLLHILRQLGLAHKANIMLHTSWRDFYNFEGKPKDIIDALLDEIGPERTLAMPAFPRCQDPSFTFDVNKTPSGAGLLTEVFRRYPGVRRSINLNHSVCAIGAHAKYLTEEHHLSSTSFDEHSPYYRLMHVGGIVMGIGVGHNLKAATSLHCVESLLRNEIPAFAQVFSERVTYQYRDAIGNLGEHTFWKRHGKINAKRLAKHMDRKLLLETNISNLKIYSIPAEYLIERGVYLARNGISIYRI